jgi:hypothetical protein
MRPGLCNAAQDASMQGGLELCRDVVADPGPATLELEDLAVEWYGSRKEVVDHRTQTG